MIDGVRFLFFNLFIDGYVLLLLLQGAAPGLLNGIIKGFKGKKGDNTPKSSKDFPNFNSASHMETVFHTVPFSKSSADIADDQELELNLGMFMFFSSTSICIATCNFGLFCIDDIEIDEPVEVVSTSSHLGKSTSKGTVCCVLLVDYLLHFSSEIYMTCPTDKISERERLFEDATSDTKPRLRTHEEIIAKYRKTGVIT